MQNRDVLKRHADLVDSMADTLGIDLEVAAMRGDLDIEEISDAVLRCTACSNPEHCAGWIEAKRSEGETVDKPVSYCRNSALFERLKA